MIRPKEKFVVNISTTFPDNTTLRQIKLYHNSSVTFPGTVTGLMWEINVAASSATVSLIYFAIVIQRAGTVITTLNVAAGSGDFYDPETNILAWGSVGVDGNANGGPYIAQHRGKSKGMRKFQNGDTLVLLAQQNVPLSTATLSGNVQFFYLS